MCKRYFSHNTVIQNSYKIRFSFSLSIMKYEQNVQLNLWNISHGQYELSYLNVQT